MRRRSACIALLSGALCAGPAFAADDGEFETVPEDGDELAPEPAAVPLTDPPSEAVDDQVPELVPIIPDFSRPVPPDPETPAPTPPTPATRSWEPTPRAASSKARPSPWLRTPRFFAYGGAALGMTGLGIGIAYGIGAQERATAYRRATVQIAAADAKAAAELTGERANVWFLAGGATLAASAIVLGLDLAGVFGPFDAPASVAPPTASLAPSLLSGGAAVTWTTAFP